MEWLHKDEQKIETLDKFMYDLLHAESGSEKKHIIEHNKHIIDTINPIDLFYLKMYQESESVEVIKESAGKFVNVFYEGLSRHEHVYEHDFFNT